ncbi:MAG: ECF transporter S component, partial [Clostridia bacterium]|nr:ECF transporter S component [Clostridia bacterium]
MSKLKFTSRDIAVASMLLAMILVFVLVPLNFIPIDIAFIPLMAVIIACQVEGGKLGVFTATMFGIASLVAAFTRPTIFSPILYNPLVYII